MAGSPVTAYNAPATTAVSATGAAAAAVTLTIPAAGAGLFNYLVLLEITYFASALLVVAATPVLVTTTGISGTPTFSMDAAANAQGVVENRIYSFGIPVKGSAANTAMTIVCPGTTSVIWRVNAFFYTDV